MIEQEKSLRAQIVKHVIAFSVGSIIGGIGWFVGNFFCAYFLGPAIWGLWQGTRLVLVYGACLHLGAQYGMQREIPILRGKGETLQQTTIINVTLTFILGVAVFVSLGVMLSTFILVMGSELRLMLRFISVMLVLEYIRVFFGTVFRANNSFDIVSRITVIDGLGHLFSVALVVPFGLLGFLGGQVLRLLAVTAYSCLRRPCNPRPEWKYTVLKPLVWIGFPMMLAVLAYAVFTSSDRLLILGFLSTEELGFYSLGTLIFMPLMLIFNVSNSVMFPRFAERYGETEDPRTLRRYITVPMENLAAFIPVCIGVIFIALPFLTEVFLPEYVEGVSAARILLFGLFFYAIAGMAGNMLVTINKQVTYLGILAGSALLNLCLSYGALRLGYGILGVAASTSVSYIVYSLVSIGVAMRYSIASWNEFARLVWKLVWPLCYVCGITRLVIYLFEARAVLIASRIGRTMVQEGILLVLCGWLVCSVLRRTGALSKSFWR